MMEHTNIGLDISDSTIELVSLDKKGRGFTVKAKGRVGIAPGIVERGEIVDAAKLAQALSAVYQQAGIPLRSQGIAFGIPESHVYIHIFSIPEEQKKQLNDILRKQLPKILPLPQKDIHFSFQTYPGANGSVRVRVLATSKKYIAAWQLFFREQGIKVNRFDSEQIATARALFSGMPKNPVAVVDIGSRTTHVGVFVKTGIVRSQTIHIAGSTFTGAIAAEQGIDMAAAEQQKAQMQISGSPTMTQVAAALGDRLVRILKETTARQNIAVADMMLVGGGSAQQGLLDVLSQTVGVPVRLGASPLVPGADVGSVFIEAVGLALPNGSDPHIEFLDANGLVPFDPKAPKKTSTIQRGQYQPLKTSQPASAPRKQGKLQSALMKHTSYGKNKSKFGIELVALLLVFILGAFFMDSVYTYRDAQRQQGRDEQAAQIQQLLERIPNIEQPPVTPISPILPPVLDIPGEELPTTTEDQTSYNAEQTSLQVVVVDRLQ